MKRTVKDEKGCATSYLPRVSEKPEDLPRCVECGGAAKHVCPHCQKKPLCGSCLWPSQHWCPQLVLKKPDQDQYAEELMPLCQECIDPDMVPEKRAEVENPSPRCGRRCNYG